MKGFNGLIVAAFACGISGQALSATTFSALKEENKSIEQKCEGEGCDAADLEKYKKNQSDLDKIAEKFRFGVAIGFEAYDEPYVNDATTVGAGRIVRVTDAQESKPTLWLETHYVWDAIGEKWGRTHSAPGFFVGVRMAGPDSELFDAFSLGPLWSFKRTAIGTVPPAGQVAESINVGIGPVWHRTRTLASGIVEGSPLPAAYNQVEYDQRDETNWMLMISAGF